MPMTAPAPIIIPTPIIVRWKRLSSRESDAVGAGAVRAWLAVLPSDVEIVPVGGVDEANLAEWVAVGATGAGIGSALYRPGDTHDRVRERARALRAAWLHAARAEDAERPGSAPSGQKTPGAQTTLRERGRRSR